jgi:hypothetical protein
LGAGLQGIRYGAAFSQEDEAVTTYGEPAEVDEDQVVHVAVAMTLPTGKPPVPQIGWQRWLYAYLRRRYGEAARVPRISKKQRRATEAFAAQVSERIAKTRQDQPAEEVAS